MASGLAPSDNDASPEGGDGARLAEVTINSDKEHVTNRTAALEQLKDIPLSISVVSGPDLQQEDAFDIGAITKRVADVSWNQGNQRTSSISIRGVGKAALGFEGLAAFHALKLGVFEAADLGLREGDLVLEGGRWRLLPRAPGPPAGIPAGTR